MEALLTNFRADRCLNIALLELIKPALDSYLEAKLAAGATIIASKVVQTWLAFRGEASPMDPEEFEGHEICHLYHCGIDIAHQSNALGVLRHLDTGLRNGSVHHSNIPDIVIHKNVIEVASEWVRDAIIYTAGLTPGTAFSCPGPVGNEIIRLEAELCVKVLRTLNKPLKFCLHQPVDDGFYHALGAENAWAFYTAPANCPLENTGCLVINS